MYADTVIEDKLVHKPIGIAVLFGLSFALFFISNLADTMFGQLLRPVIGDPAASGLFGRAAVAFVLAVAFVINIVAIGFLSRPVQVVIVWIELLIAFLAFFYAFNLSYEFIQKKIWFMVTQGVWTTLYVSAISITLAFIVAMIGAVAKLSNNGFAFGIASFYTSFFRGVPLLVQVYLIYVGLPQLGIIVDAVPAGVIALTLCYGAYMTEIFRAGIESVSKGQWEGSRAMGFKFGLTMRRIILPQAIPVIIPATGNQFIAMLKDSSLVSVLGVWEIMFLARKLGSRDFKHLEMLITAAILYWILTMVLEAVQARIERHYRKIKQQ